jgi:hypothetical protein
MNQQKMQKNGKIDVCNFFVGILSFQSQKAVHDFFSTKFIPMTLIAMHQTG